MKLTEWDIAIWTRGDNLTAEVNGVDSGDTLWLAVISVWKE